MVAQLIGIIAPILKEVVGKYIEDKKITEQIERDFKIAVMEKEKTIYQMARDVIVAEAKGSWLQRNWRPLVMLMWASIPFYNYVIVPSFGKAPLPLPPDIWGMISAGMFGYMGFRTLEKKWGVSK